MDKCRTDVASYHNPYDSITAAKEEKEDNRRSRRADDFWSIFVHGTGTKNEDTDLAENILLQDEDLYLAVIKFIANEIGLAKATCKLGVLAQEAAINYKDECILDGSDKWTGE